MKTERNVFLYIFIFFLIVTPIYVVMTDGKELAGAFVLGFTGILGAMIGGYIWLKGSKLDRPEDRADGEIWEKAGDVGFFAPHSIWPFWCAVIVAAIFLGIALHQVWIVLLAIGVGIWACSGLVLEFYRGDYRH